MADLSIPQIKLRITVTVLLVVSFVLASFAWQIFEQRNSDIEDAEHQTAGYARALAEHAERSFAETDRVLRDVLLDIQTAGDIQTIPSSQLYNLMKRQTEGAPQIGDMFVVNANGEMISNTNHFPPKPIDVSDRDYFKYYATTPDAGLTLGTTVKSRLVNRWRFNLMRPLAAPGEPFAGLLAVAFEVEYFKRFLNAASIGTSGKIFLIQANGKPLVLEPYQEKAYQTDFTTSALIKKHLPHAPSGTFQIEKNGITPFPGIVSYQKLSSFPVVAAVSINRDEVLAHWRIEALKQSILTVTLCLVIAVLGLIMFRHLNRLQRSDEALRSQQEQLQLKATQIDSAQEAILLITPEGRLLQFNPALCRLTGYSAKELQGILLADIEPTAYGKQFELNSRELREQGEATFESAFRKKDGAIVPVEGHARFMEGVEPPVILSIVRDISERKSIEQREKTRLKILEQMASNASLPVILADIVAFVEQQSPGTFCSVLLVDESGTILRHGAAPSLPEAYNRAVDGLRIGNKMGSCGTAAFLQQRVVVEDIEGHPFWKGFTPARDAGLRSCWSEPILSANAEVLGTFAMYHREPKAPTAKEIALIESAAHLASIAISRERGREQQEALQDQLQHIQKIESIGQLAGGIAHDFNNLLTPILIYSEMLKKIVPAGESNLSKLEGIIKAANKAKDLTQKLLSVSRKHVLCMEPVDLNAVINEMEDMLRRSIGERITLVRELSVNRRVVTLGDKGLVEQLVLNLIVNARDSITEVGTITIRTGRVMVDAETARQKPGMMVGDAVVLTIADSGCGMTKEVQDHIFEPFFTTKETGKGTGLGLAMVYGIVKQHYGYIGVSSRAGAGTTFTVYFPAQPTESLPADTLPTAAVKDHSLLCNAPTVILLAEDNEIVRTMTRELLTMSGYTVLEAALPSQALAVAADPDQAIDLLLTDVVMPEMNGRQLYDRVCEFRPSLPVLFMSGYTDDIELNMDEHIERSNFLHKPFTTEQMLRAVKTSLAG